MSRIFLTAALVVSFAVPLKAAPVDDLLDALRVDDMLDIMRAEGLSYGDDLAMDMFPSGPSPRWSALISDLYDTDKMEDVVRSRFADVLPKEAVAPLLEFYSSDQGRDIVEAEIAARRAMVDEVVEEAARETFRDIDGEDDARLVTLTDFIEANDLIEANVAGALNASLQFYKGLVDGGAIEMGETEILRDVWSQEAETRADTREWLFSYLLLAYDPLGAEVLEAYVDLSKTDEGRMMNRALFAGFNQMYDDISYALGLAAAQQMRGQDL